MSDSNSVASSTGSQKNAAPWWFKGAVMVFLASLIGLISLGLFCYAYGLNFQDEGWAANPDGTPQIKQMPLMVSFAGMVAATLLFWWGFMQITRIRKPQQ